MSAFALDIRTTRCSAALGPFPYTPKNFITTLKHFYSHIGARTWGIYGFHDGFNQNENSLEILWMGLNQVVIVVTVENYRPGVTENKTGIELQTTPLKSQETDIGANPVSCEPTKD